MAPQQSSSQCLQSAQAAGATISEPAKSATLDPATSAETAISYRDQSLATATTTHGHFNIEPGDRMPYFLLDGTNVFQQLAVPKFHLVMATDGQEQPSDPQFSREVEDWTDVTVVPLYPHLVDVFGTKKPFTMLLRPDNYLAAIWPGLDTTLAQDWLAHLFTAQTAECLC